MNEYYRAALLRHTDICNDVAGEVIGYIPTDELPPDHTCVTSMVPTDFLMFTTQSTSHLAIWHESDHSRVVTDGEAIRLLHGKLSDHQQWDESEVRAFLKCEGPITQLTPRQALSVFHASAPLWNNPWLLTSILLVACVVMGIVEPYSLAMAAIYEMAACLAPCFWFAGAEMPVSQCYVIRKSLAAISIMVLVPCDVLFILTVYWYNSLEYAYTAVFVTGWTGLVVVVLGCSAAYMYYYGRRRFAISTRPAQGDIAMLVKYMFQSEFP